MAKYAENKIDDTVAQKEELPKTPTRHSKHLSIGRKTKQDKDVESKSALGIGILMVLIVSLGVIVYYGSTRVTPAKRAALNKALWLAAKDGNLKEVASLIRKGADISSTTDDAHKVTALHIAASHGHLELTRFLLQNGANIQATGAENLGVLYCALQGPTPSLQVIELLLSSGANTGARYKNDRTPLHLAAHRGLDDIVKLLIVNGADINARSALHGFTPLHMAASEGKTDTYFLLLKGGASPDIRDKEGKTAQARLVVDTTKYTTQEERIREASRQGQLKIYDTETHQLVPEKRYYELEDQRSAARLKAEAAEQDRVRKEQEAQDRRRQEAFEQSQRFRHELEEARRKDRAEMLQKCTENCSSRCQGRQGLDWADCERRCNQQCSNQYGP